MIAKHWKVSDISRSARRRCGCLWGCVCPSTCVFLANQSFDCLVLSSLTCRFFSFLQIGSLSLLDSLGFTVITIFIGLTRLTILT